MPRRTERGVRPGFSLLDWNRLNQHAKDLAQRKGAPLRAISAAEVAEHASEYDAWTILKGKVYNMTPYLHYHPGGVQILLPSAGRDCTQQFDKFHRWINGHSMMAGCELGWLDPPEAADLDDEEDDDTDDDSKSEEKSARSRGGP